MPYSWYEVATIIIKNQMPALVLYNYDNSTSSIEGSMTQLTMHLSHKQFEKDNANQGCLLLSMLYSVDSSN